MFKFTITLKQHTPLIHFQHDQEGATLRASEVKPKLDKFIINNEFNAIFNNYKHHLIGYSINNENKLREQRHDFNALNYKLKIIAAEVKIDRSMRPSFYFGNMGENCGKKFQVSNNILTISIFSFDSKLIEVIKKHIAVFFETYNFGARQSKGYGGFSVIKIDGKSLNKIPSSNLFFDLTGNLKKVMENIQLFYNALRAGINNPKSGSDTKFYFKSLIFLYARHKNIQWEKRTIKEYFANSYFNKSSSKKIIGKLEEHEKKWDFIKEKALFPLYYTATSKYIVKDVFGLSIKENWLDYPFYSIEKIHEAIDPEKAITRFKSPLLIKIHKLNEATYRIWVIIDKEQEKLLNEKILGSKFYIVSGRYKGDKSTSKLRSITNKNLCFKASFIPAHLMFSFNDFFDFLLKENSSFNIDNHVDDSLHEESEFTILKGIFQSLKNNYNARTNEK